MIRTYLFVPGDSPKKFAKASEGPSDALILDLEDSVASDSKDSARIETRKMLSAPRRGQKIFVRVNALDTGLTLTDLAAVMSLDPDGIVLPKCSGAEDLRRLHYYLDAFETTYAPSRPADILAIVTETAGSIFGLGSYQGVSSRLTGMMWGAEDLAADLGARENSHNGFYHDPYRMARNLCLCAASAAKVHAIDTICASIDDISIVTREANEARRDGFAGKAVIHPKHVEAVNAAFTPTEQEIDWAKRVLSAFAENPEAGVVKIDGKMIDKPHERAARKVLGNG